MEDISDRFLEAISQLQEVADSLPADEAREGFETTTLQVFWRDWPNISSWAGALWRQLNEDLAQPATPVQDPELDEVGGSE